MIIIFPMFKTLLSRMPPWLNAATHFLRIFEPFKRQPRKIVKHTRTILRQFTNELFEFV